MPGRVLEEGATAEVLAAPRHAYTRALLAATPRADRPAETLRPVPPALIEQLMVGGAPARSAAVLSGAGMSDILVRTASLRVRLPDSATVCFAQVACAR